MIRDSVRSVCWPLLAVLGSAGIGMRMGGRGFGVGITQSIKVSEASGGKTVLNRNSSSSSGARVVATFLCAVRSVVYSRERHEERSKRGRGSTSHF